jgi:hypothetical protein
VEAFGYTESFGGRSPQNPPRSANPPHYPAHTERRHLPSHQPAWRATFPYLTRNQPGRDRPQAIHLYQVIISQRLSSSSDTGMRWTAARPCHQPEATCRAPRTAHPDERGLAGQHPKTILQLQI